MLRKNGRPAKIRRIWKRVEALIREKERLISAKAKLEQRLRDLTEVDINMEKKRKKVK
jgi:hypothetical protein